MTFARAIWRRTRWLILVALGYAVLGALWSLANPDQGLISPDGDIDLATALALASVLGLRLVVLFVLAPLIVYRLLDEGLARITGSGSLRFRSRKSRREDPAART